MAFVLIQHLDPSHESMLAEIIAKTTRKSSAGNDRTNQALQEHTAHSDGQ
jgi:hypothetical protein